MNLKSLGIDITRGIFKKHQYGVGIRVVQDLSSYGKLKPALPEQKELQEWKGHGYFNVSK